MFLDLTRDKCPITFVKTKVALERLKKSCSLIVRINKGNDLDSMQKSLEEIGFKITKNKHLKNNVAEIIIQHI